MRYYILTFCIILLMASVSLYVRIPFPETQTYLNMTFEGQYKVFDIKEHLTKYEFLKTGIRNNQCHFSENFHKFDPQNQKKLIEKTKTYLFETITKEIIPYWLETEWDFNGTTENPRDGAIACGYFVSTILLHAGIDLDKYHLSREASSVMIDNLCQKNSIVTIFKNDFEKLMDYINRQEDGLYIIGLETHVGILEKRGTETYFIHSRKPKNIGVVKERAINSTSLQKSKIYVVGNLLENERLIENWLSRS